MSNSEKNQFNKLLINLSYILSKPTGTSTYILNLLSYLSSLHPTLLVSQPISTYSYHLVPTGLTPEQGLKGHFRRILWTQLQLPKIYKKQQQSPLLFSPIPEAPLFSNCRYIVTVHDLIPLRFPKRRSPLTPYFRYYIPQVLAQAQHILCNSIATAKDITDFFQIPAEKITPILLAHDADRFRCLDLKNQVTLPKPFLLRGGEVSSDRTLSKGGETTSDRPYFLYIGRHDPYKNLKRLIDAFAAIPNRQDYELWIAGSNDRRYTPTLQAQADELDLSDRVKFLDYVPYEKLPIIINQAIALVFPSLWEGFGFPVLEAMACGTPVITSNLSSLPEVAGDAALLINPYNTHEIAQAMQAVATDSDLRSRLRTLGLNRASQFSWEKTGQATVEVIQRYL
jgi:glycosyltransferase involved in cell wall biosynthesis